MRKRDFQKGIVRAREIVISGKKGLLRDGVYCEHIYTRPEIIKHLKKIGFKKISIKNKLSLHSDPQDYGFLTSRMMITAEK